MGPCVRRGHGSTDVAVDPTRRFAVRARSAIGDLDVGDRVLVQAKVCKADLKNDAKPSLTASKVIAHPAKPANDQEDDD